MKSGIDQIAHGDTGNMAKSYWRNKNVFITGCTGLLGAWLTKYLIEKGANVIGLIRDWVPGSNLFQRDCFDNLISVRGSIEDYALLERILGEYEIDTVFHVAAQTIVTIANRNPLSTFEANIRGTWQLLEACRRSPLVKKVIIASSDKAYGRQEQLPYTEESPLQGEHPYDVSKSCSDLIARSYHVTYGLPLCITRCGNFYGGGDLNFNRLIPGTIRSIIFGERPIIRSDGNYIRDYFYIEDAVEAYVHLAKRMDDPQILGEAFNFSNENQMTVLEIVKRVLSLMDSDLEPIILNETKGEIRNQYLSAAKAREVLNWHPKIDVDDNLRKAIDWYRTYFEDLEK